MALVLTGSEKALMKPVARAAGRRARQLLVEEVVPRVVNAGWQLVESHRKKKKKVKGQGSGGMQLIPVSQPIATTVKQTVKAPKIKTNAKGSIIVSHSEYVGDVDLNSSFGVTSYVVNPTNPRMFPWLYSVAEGYEQYRFKRIRFRFVTQGPTTTTGRVILAYDRDSTDPDPVSKQEVYSFQGTVDGPTWGNLVLNMPCDNIVRFTDDTSVVDRKLIDHGKLMFSGSSDATGIDGEVFIDYDIELMVPQRPGSFTQTFRTGSGAVLVSKTGPNYCDYTPDTLFFDTPGTYSVTWSVAGTSLTTGTFTTSGPISILATQSAGVNSFVMVHLTILCTSQGAFLNNGWGGGTIVNSRIDVSQTSALQA